MQFNDLSAAFTLFLLWDGKILAIEDPQFQINGDLRIIKDENDDIPLSYISDEHVSPFDSVIMEIKILRFNSDKRILQFILDAQP